MPGHHIYMERRAPVRAAFWELRLALPARPRQAFRAWTCEPAATAWMTGPGSPIAAVRLDGRKGGRWRHEYDWEGTRFTQRGSFRRFEPDTVLERVEDGADGEAAFVTLLTFAAEGDGTLLSYRAAYASERERDRAVATGTPDQVAHMLRRLHAFLSGDLDGPDLAKGPE